MRERAPRAWRAGARSRSAPGGACRRAAGAPHGGYRGEEADPVLVDDRAEAEQQIGTEGRGDEEVLPGEPREETVADQPVPEVGRQEAEGAGVGGEPELLAQRAPPGGQRGVGVH